MNTLLKNWHPLEMLWLIFAPILLLLTSLSVSDSWMTTVSSVLGAFFVILAAKGKWYCFLFGMLHCLLYGIISLQNNLYGEAILKLCYAIPVHITATFLWYKNTSKRTYEVIHQNLNSWNKFLQWIIILGVTAFVAQILHGLGGKYPFADAFTTVASTWGAYLMARRCAEMWQMFIFINIASVYMWYQNYIDCGGHLATLIMWIIWTINSVYGYIKWNKT